MWKARTAPQQRKCLQIDSFHRSSKRSGQIHRSLRRKQTVAVKSSSVFDCFVSCTNMYKWKNINKYRVWFCAHQRKYRFCPVSLTHIKSVCHSRGLRLWLVVNDRRWVEIWVQSPGCFIYEVLTLSLHRWTLHPKREWGGLRFLSRSTNSLPLLKVSFLHPKTCCFFLLLFSGFPRS